MRYSLILLFVLCINALQAQENTVKNTTFNDHLQVTRYRLHPKELGISNEIESEKVYIKIYYNKFAGIKDDYNYFKPKQNEILFFYGINAVTNETEMFFKVHSNLKEVYKKKNFKQFMQVIKVLEYNVFSEDKFSSAEAYAALEQI